MNENDLLERLALAILTQNRNCHGPCGNKHRCCCYFCPEFETCEKLECDEIVAKLPPEEGRKAITKKFAICPNLR